MRRGKKGSSEEEKFAMVIPRGLCRYSCCERQELSRGAVRLCVAALVVEFRKVSLGKIPKTHQKCPS